MPSDTETLDLGSTADMEIPQNSSFNYIGSKAFAKAANLKQLTIPDTVYGIFENAFSGVQSEKLILNFEGITPPSLIRDTSDHAFESGIEDSRTEIHVPEGYEETYIREWRYALAGYENLDEVKQAVTEELKTASEAGAEPSETEINNAAAWKLLPAENRIRAMMGLEQLEKPSDLSEDNKDEAFTDAEQKETTEMPETPDKNTEENSDSGMEIVIDAEESGSDSADSDMQEETEPTEEADQAEEMPDAAPDTETSEEEDPTEQDAESADVSAESEEDIEE